ncbi:ATP-dependent Clp protease adapter ClpS [Lampropedia hyalina]|uniref:ATP-dependent Clp protease adapter ClpS n=1 Tax=Lampropedia hyalina TaxID=198706 RepID=UPI0009341F1E|nr:ATP-dependent Clp protease adapter ClpS [Lampropedia hyalina]
MVHLAASLPPKAPRTPPAIHPRHADEAAVVLERKLQKSPPPPMYQVVMLNDDYTPMEFVVDVLQSFFNKDEHTANMIMQKVHMEGRGVCGVYTRDIAHTKVALVMDAAAQAGHPLQCVAEPAQE